MCTTEGLFPNLSIPPTPLKQTTSKQDSLGPRQKAACGFVFFRCCCSCCVLSLFESCILLSLISVFPHCCQWFVVHLLTWHHITSRRHNSTWHPRLIASITTHVHFIRACLSTVVTLSSKESCMNIYQKCKLCKCKKYHNALMCVNCRVFIMLGNWWASLLTHVMHLCSCEKKTVLIMLHALAWQWSEHIAPCLSVCVPVLMYVCLPVCHYGNTRHTLDNLHTPGKHTTLCTPSDQQGNP